MTCAVRIEYAAADVMAQLLYAAFQNCTDTASALQLETHMLWHLHQLQQHMPVCASQHTESTYTPLLHVNA